MAPTEASKPTSAGPTVSPALSTLSPTAMSQDGCLMFWSFFAPFNILRMCP
jgi:hypothetical protein